MPSGDWTRVDHSAQLVAKELGLATTPERLADVAGRQAIAKRLATLVVDQIAGAPLDDLGRALELTEPLARTPAPTFITFSGGVAEYIFGRETADHGDIARCWPTEIVAQFKHARVDPDHRAERAHPRDRDRRVAIHRAGQR